VLSFDCLRLEKNCELKNPLEDPIMSTVINLLHPVAVPRIVDTPASEAVAAPTAEQRAPSDDYWGQEQIRLLVRQLFFPGSPKPPRHVVFSAVDESTYIAETCMDVARTLAAHVSGSVCLMEGNSHRPELEEVYGTGKQNTIADRDGFGFLRTCSQHISERLWLAPYRLLAGSTEDGKSPAWLERRLGDFRLEFDYTVLHAPVVGKHSEAAWLGRLSDGVVLVLEANSSRRATALRARELLTAANARLLGTVLSERTFPIPEGIYQRL
jgi:hypothetical protein